MLPLMGLRCVLGLTKALVRLTHMMVTVCITGKQGIGLEQTRRR